MVAEKVSSESFFSPDLKRDIRKYLTGKPFFSFVRKKNAA